RLTHFSETNLHGLIDRLAAELREAQPRQYQKWGFDPRGGSYQTELKWMKRWLSARVDFIDRQLPGPPRMARGVNPEGHGFRFVLSVPDRSTNAAVYYTLDGSDPRLPQGNIS